MQAEKLFSGFPNGRLRGAVLAVAAGLCPAGLCTAGLCTAGFAQEKGTLNAEPLPPISNPDDPAVPARELFGRAIAPSGDTARVIGFYSRGCLAGAKALPVTGDAWRVMRLSRDRNWGHPALIDFLEKFARRVPKVSSWPGVLVGDMSQPRGGPMRTGHASHQIGLDADIWLTPMPHHELSKAEREEMSAVNMVSDDRLSVNAHWTKDQMAVVKTAAQAPEVERIFVNAAIKKAMCTTATGDRTWLHKVRPFYGHNYHFHVRIACPEGENACKPQDAVPAGDGCDASLNYWFSNAVLHPRPPKKPVKPRPPLTMAQLPPECRRVLGQ